jgi:signal transduction histidine kinase
VSGAWQTTRQTADTREAIADQEERDFRVWLRNVERRAILPLKWAIFFTAVLFWMLSHRRGGPPPVDVFALFTSYFMFTLGATYFLVLNRVTLSQIRIVSVFSYYVDVVFVTLLIYLEARFYPATDATSTDFYIYYFLLVLRGFALFRTAWGNLLANMVIAGIFVLSLFWQDADFLSYSSRNNLIRIVFIWLVILMSWFIVQVLNRQKAELLRTREKLVQSENLALVGELAAGVAHEINNPIGIISTYSEFLLRNADPEDPRKQDFEVIHSEANRCEAIVKELLTYARPSSHDIVPIDIGRLNDEVIEFAAKRGGSHSRIPVITREYEPKLPMPLVDVGHLKQALLNIYLNAFQALEGNLEPRVTCHISCDTTKSNLVIAVTDNGPGISRDDLRRIFDPFFTTRARGTGLGLSITRRLIEAGGGEIVVKSKKGRGTTVEIHLPIDDA